jgi:hypothetical protein
MPNKAFRIEHDINLLAIELTLYRDKTSIARKLLVLVVEIALRNSLRPQEF